MKDRLARHIRSTSALLLLPLLFLLFGLGRCTTPSAAAGYQTENKGALIGTYTRKEGHVDGKAAGIYLAEINIETGEVKKAPAIIDVANPSFLTIRSDERVLLAISELAREGEPSGYLHSYQLRGDGSVKEISQLLTGAKAPCHVELDQTEQYAIVSNYLGGVAQLYSVAKNGRLEVTDVFNVSDAAKGGRGSNLHSANFSPDNGLVIIADLGLDKLWMFSLDLKEGKLVPHPHKSVELDKGAGPRHTVWSEDGRFLYVINEYGNSIDVLAYKGFEAGFERIQTIKTLPDGFSGKSSCADIHLHPSGRFLYGSNRGHNSIASFLVNAADGTLTATGHQSTEGEIPRNFAVAPNGKFLFVANQNSSNIATLRIDPLEGTLSTMRRSFSIPTPVCIEFLK